MFSLYANLTHGLQFDHCIKYVVQSFLVYGCIRNINKFLHWDTDWLTDASLRDTNFTCDFLYKRSSDFFVIPCQCATLYLLVEFKLSLICRYLGIVIYVFITIFLSESDSILNASNLLFDVEEFHSPCPKIFIRSWPIWNETTSDICMSYLTIIINIGFTELEIITNKFKYKYI